jgi:ribosomal protein S14
MTKHANFKDFLLRKNLKTYQDELLILKCILLNKKNSAKIRFKIMLKLHKLYKDLLGNRIKNRCMSSTKVRSVSRLTNLTKSSFRENLR